MADEIDLPLHAQQVADALRQASGIIMGAATILNCPRRTVEKYISHYPAVKAAYEEEMEKTVDKAETEQLRALKRGERWAVENILFNSRQGRERGWMRHAERANDAALLNAIQIVIPGNGRDQLAVNVEQFDSPEHNEIRQYSYPVTLEELKHEQMTAHLLDSHSGPDPLFQGLDDDELLQ